MPRLVDAVGGVLCVADSATIDFGSWDFSLATRTVPAR